MSPNDTYPQHVVTAVIVAHDGAAWLPQVIQALLEQTRPVQRVVAVDTGSRDRSGSVLAGLLGQSVVFGMDRGTGYSVAVHRALQHRAANVNVPGAAGPPSGDRVEWVWLLHDDSEPAPDALEQLLRGAAETRSAAVLGPKVKDWADRRVILEAGITVDTVGRRITGIEPREVDQGQHDGDRDCLAVGSAGMLVRRDVWDSVRGFDTGMALFREDVDFCWRVHEAGHRVRVITDAVLYHVEASARRRRPISVARRPRQLDRRNAMLTLAGNLPAGPMLASAAANLTVSLMRAAFFLVAKRLAAALDELAAVGSVLGHPLRLLAMRRARARGRRTAYGRLRRDLPSGQSLRKIAEFAAAAQAKSGQVDTAGSHHATDDPEEADFLLTDIGLVQRMLTSPGVLLFLCLTVVSLVAERSLLGSGPLAGGALVPAWGGAGGLWGEYLQGFHPVGVGSSSSAPPYLALIAALATLLGGKPWLAVDVILLGCVPLAGLSAYLAVRRVTRSVPVRVWAAASYALLPVAMGAVAGGRIGTAVVFVLVPAMALLTGRMLTQPARRARRAAWATGLTVALAAAFVPLVWVVALVAALALFAARPGAWRNLAIVAAVPPVLLMPWTLQVAAHPSTLLLEAGLQQPGLASHDLAARSLMLLSPGGPGLPPVW
ncbi:MAG TPA: glycosyltransferase family 2 protein, partial [Streptosporangiaceae bacterium]|nr:glycosyltransferase family 2 protein [Streptosporangiaceae bacterium]